MSVDNFFCRGTQEKACKIIVLGYIAPRPLPEVCLRLYKNPPALRAFVENP